MAVTTTRFDSTKQVSLEGLGIESHLGNENNTFFEVKEVDPVFTQVVDNIRPINEDHVRNLALSILAQGQLQECIGIDTGDGILVIAGAHRRLAILSLNSYFEGKGIDKRIPLRIRVYNKELTPAEIFTIQLEENMQNPMTATEKADAIGVIWDLYKQAYDDKETSMADLARRTGFTPEAISNAVRFMKLDKRVAEMARNHKISYGTAIDISKIELPEKQFEVATHIVLVNMKPEKIKSYVMSLVLDSSSEGMPLFGNAGLEVAKAQKSLGIEKTVGYNAQEAAGYFHRVLSLLKQYPDLKNMFFTDGVLSILSMLIKESDAFREIIKRDYNDFYQQILSASGEDEVI